MQMEDAFMGFCFYQTEEQNKRKEKLDGLGPQDAFRTNEAPWAYAHRQPAQIEPAWLKHPKLSKEQQQEQQKSSPPKKAQDMLTYANKPVTK